MLKAMFIFVLAGLAEIGGGYLVWLWLRESRSLWYGIIGSIILILYGIIPTLQSFPSFGRIYAAYGGVFVVLAVLWGWLIDKKPPDLYDWISSCLHCWRFHHVMGAKKLNKHDFFHDCLAHSPYDSHDIKIAFPIEKPLLFPPAYASIVLLPFIR